MKKPSLLSISVSFAILLAVGILSVVAGQNSDPTADFLNNWTAKVNSQMPMRINEVDFTKAFSYCPQGCQGKSNDYHIRIRGKVFGYSFNNPSWTRMAKMNKPHLLSQYCSSGANLRNIELLSATYDSTEKHVYYYRIKPNECPASTTPNSSAPNTVEEQFWNLVKDSKRVADFKSYIEQYPRGKYTAIANLKVSQLSGQPTNTPNTPTTNTSASPIEEEFWNLIKNGNRRSDFQSYLNQYPKGKYVAIARLKVGNNTSPVRPSSLHFLQFRAPTPNLSNMAYMRRWAAKVKAQVPLNFGDTEIYRISAPTKNENYFYISAWTPRLSAPVDTRSQSKTLKTRFIPYYCSSEAARRKITLAVWVSDNNKKKNFGHMLTPGDCGAKQPTGNSNGTGSTSQTSGPQTNPQFLNTWAKQVRVGLPEMIGDFQLINGWSRCPSGCKESDNSDYLLLNFNALGLQKNLSIYELEIRLKPHLLTEYCKTEAPRRNIKLGVFFDNRAANRKVNFWVYPKDCPSN